MNSSSDKKLKAAERSKKYRIAHKDELKKYHKKYYQNNKDKFCGSYRPARAAYRSRNRERISTKSKNVQLRLRYGITIEDYEQLLKKQNGVCAICKQAESIIDKRTNRPRQLSVDHCHVTKRVRGLLCNQCNNGLGRFRENAEYCLSAAKYLKEDANAKSGEKINW